MIEYALICENGHRFDAWFRSARTYDDQRAHGTVTCPSCASTAVDKAPMAPAVSRARADSVALAAGHPEHEKLREALRALRSKVESEADYVGDRFAEEARRIHYGEVDPRGIYGEATREEAVGLAEEGIAFLPLPVLPEDGN